MKKVKNEIAKKLKAGDIEPHEAQILEQRAPAAHAIASVPAKGGHAAKSYVKTGVPGFDALFEKGIPKGSTILMAGGAGSGKTIFCLQMAVYQATHGKKCFYMSFEENEEHLMEHMRDFGWDPEALIDSGMLRIKKFSPLEVGERMGAVLARERGSVPVELAPMILGEGFEPDFIVLDSLSAVASAFPGKDGYYRIYIEQLFDFFESLGSTTFLIAETTQVPEIFSPTGIEEFLADGVIVLYNIKRGDTRESAVEVLKMRGSKHEKKIVAMQITDRGINVYPEQQIFGDIKG